MNEGPAVIHHDGRIYLTYSASETGAAYCMGMLTADENSDLLDPKSWTKERYPVLRTDESRGIYGPGHNPLLKTKKETRSWFIMREQKQRLKEIRCTIQTVMPC